MRETFSDEITRLAEADERFLVLSGDHGYALFDKFRSKYPTRFINAGIAEQNMVGVAAGLAKQGFKPLVYGLSSFVPIRVLEQIKMDVAYENLGVTFCGDGAGFVYSHLGPSHQSTEDIAALRAIPNLSIYSPSDRHELQRALRDAHQSGSPTYIRMGKADSGIVHDFPFTERLPGLVDIAVNSRHGMPSFLATGALVNSARLLASTHFPQASVYSVPRIKPLDVTKLLEIVKRSSYLVVFEEHSIFGGLGSAIAEFASGVSPIPILRIGVEDAFSKEAGTYNYLLTEHGLDQVAMLTKVSDFHREFESRPQLSLD